MINWSPLSHSTHQERAALSNEPRPSRDRRQPRTGGEQALKRHAVGSARIGGTCAPVQGHTAGMVPCVRRKRKLA